MSQNISVSGWFGRGNCGDELYLTTFPLVFPNINFSFYPHPNIPQDNNPIIMGGGDIVYKKWIDLIKNKPNKKHLVSVSLSSCDCITELNNIFDQIIVRDIESFNKLKSIGVDKVKLYPDLAFCLKGDKEYGKKLIKELFEKSRHDLYDKLIVVVVNSYLISKTDGLAREELSFQKFAMDLATICDDTPASFLFIPFSCNPPFDDRCSNSWISSKCKFWKKNLVVYDQLTPHQILSIFTAADYAITSRLHASIFSIISHTPFYDVTHHSKNMNMLKTFNLEDCSGSYWKFDAEKLKTHLLNNLKTPEVLLNKLQNIDEKCKKELKELQCISF